MKKSSRETNIFSMSALDLFASALGAFILLAIMALPFFTQTHRLDDETLLERIEEVRAELEATETALQDREAELQAREAELREQSEARADAEEELAACQAEREHDAEMQSELQAELEQCAQAAQATFLLVLMSWDTSDDVDLHVTDPHGNEFFYGARTHAGSDARFEEDNIQGPGNEVWLHPQATPGTYRVEYNLYSQAGSASSVTVRGAALHRDGRDTLPEVVLTHRGDRRLVTEIRVAPNGEVTVGP